MRLDAKSLLLGAAGAVGLLGVAAALLLLFSGGVRDVQPHRTLRLSSGRALEVTALYLGWGDDHSGRGSIDDGLCVEYVTAAADTSAREREAAEVFEAVRPMADALGLSSAEVSAFPTLKRKGRYERWEFSRGSGAWTSRHVEAKVFVND